jgi:hypothetical protein
VGSEAAPMPDDIAGRLRDTERNAAWSVPKLDLAAPPDTQHLTPDT